MRRSIVISVVLMGLTGCGGSSAGSSSKSSAGTTSAPPQSAGASCRTVPAPTPKGPQHLSAPRIKLDPSKTYTVTVNTNCGTFAFALEVKRSPKTSASFYALVKRGFFDGLTFHRVAAGFVIQEATPTATALAARATR